MKINNSLGLSVDFLDNGSVRTIDADPVRISLRVASPFSGSAANIWLRKRGSRIIYRPLFGPGSDSRFTAGKNFFSAKGNWEGIVYSCTLRLSERSLSWEWSVDIQNNSGAGCELDLIYLQDVGLKVMSSGPVNEYYVSQYIERRILEDEVHGSVICCRQNMKEAGGHPWIMIACVNGAAAASTDGMQFYGRTFRETGIPEGLLADRPGGEYAGESSVVTLQEVPFDLPDGERHRSAFVATFLHNHPPATSDYDLDRLPGLIREFAGDTEAETEGAPETGIADEPVSEIADDTMLETADGHVAPAWNLFANPDLLPVEDLTDAEIDSFFGRERRHCETHNGQLLSFFCGDNNHVVLRAKESLADRPHGHIMQAATGYVPDERIMSTTAFAFGVFNSHITQGNTNFNTLLSVCNSQFNLSPETGQRILVEIDGSFRLLGVPSAFEIGLNSCRWIYKSGDNCFQVRTWTSVRSPRVSMEFTVISGDSRRLLITHHFDDLNCWTISPGDTEFEFIARPGRESMIASRFPDARFRLTVRPAGTEFGICGDEVLTSSLTGQGSNLFVIETGRTSAFGMSFTGEVWAGEQPAIFNDPDQQWISDRNDAREVWNDLSRGLSLEGGQADIAAIREILPWYGMNALTHFLTPYGLEQFSGAAWGTRDISQGPLELLLSMQKFDEAKQVLRTIFSNQDPDGGWPQWWMFDSYDDIRADSAHGDVIYWCLIALCNYIKVTGDFEFLDEILPFHHDGKTAETSEKSLAEHINRLVKKVIADFVPGTSLVQFGGGDWNDSLQPVSKDLARRMISSWTVEMNYQAFIGYTGVLQMMGDDGKASEFAELCERIKSDFNRYLVRDGVVAGYGLAEDDGSISLLLHPADERTGIKYSILPMNRGIISGIFTEEQAQKHQEVIEEHLKGPDGARLMDRPLRYNGGIQTLFQRAESSTFFGREIGLMYVHEHIRYAEALAITGKADAFVRALRQAIPVACSDVVPCSDIRQSNCYYSSSDVIFANRFEADRLYSEIKGGNITLRGGWRVYSSGPGIYIGIIVSRLLGLRLEWGKVIIDPVLPFSFDGLTASMNFMERRLLFRYEVRKNNFGPKTIRINGREVDITHEENPYRPGGAVISAGTFSAMLDKPENRIEIYL